MTSPYGRLRIGNVLDARKKVLQKRHKALSDKIADVEAELANIYKIEQAIK